jgi:hypothetical protein
MYDNDFAALLRYLREDGRKVEIRAGEAAWLDGAEDLSELRRRERGNLRLTVEQPPVEIVLGDNSRVWTNEVDFQPAKDLVDGVDSLCGSWRTVTARFNAVTIGWTPCIGLAFEALVLGITLAGKGWSGVISQPSIFLMAAAFSGAFILISVLSSSHRIHVSPRSRHAANERRLQVVGTIGISFFSGAVGSLLTWLLTR